jgi:hypothetical protein
VISEGLLFTPNFVAIGTFVHNSKGRTNIDCIAMEPTFFLNERNLAAKNLLYFQLLL